MGIAEELKKWRMEAFEKNNRREVSEEKEFVCLSADSLPATTREDQFELLSDSDQSDIIQIPLKQPKLHKNGAMIPKGKSFIKNKRVFVIPEGDTGEKSRKRKKPATRFSSQSSSDGMGSDKEVVFNLTSKAQGSKRLKPLGLTRPIRRNVPQLSQSSPSNGNCNSHVEQTTSNGANEVLDIFDVEKEEDELLKPAFHEYQESVSANLEVRLLDQKDSKRGKLSAVSGKDSDSDLSLFELDVDLADNSKNTKKKNGANNHVNADVKRQVAAVTPSLLVNQTSADVSSRTPVISSDDSDIEIPLVSKKGKQPANKSKTVYVKRSKETRKKAIRTDNSRLVVMSPTEVDQDVTVMETTFGAGEENTATLSPLRIDDDPAPVSYIVIHIQTKM